jgi:hypothetical protein
VAFACCAASFVSCPGSASECHAPENSPYAKQVAADPGLQSHTVRIGLDFSFTTFTYLLAAGLVSIRRPVREFDRSIAPLLDCEQAALKAMPPLRSTLRVWNPGGT